LGLAIVKHIVEIHDAKIELDSSPGVGTAISVMF
jgi:two-component system phosphate regulon sensor histidine kinase PhoR